MTSGIGFGKRHAAARELWLQRNSKVLVRRIKKKAKQSFELVEKFKVEDNQFWEIYKTGIAKNMAISANKYIEHVLKYSGSLYHILLYCNVVQRRFENDLFKIVKLMEKTGAGELSEDLIKLKQLLAQLRTYIVQQKHTARRLRTERKVTNANFLISVHHHFREIWLRAKQLRTQIHKEQNDDHIIIRLLKSLEDYHKEKQSENNQDSKVKSTSNLDKKIHKIVVQLKTILLEEIKIIKAESVKIAEIQNHASYGYILILNQKEDLSKIYTKFTNKHIESPEFDTFKEKYKKFEENLKKQETMEYYMEKNELSNMNHGQEELNSATRVLDARAQMEKRNQKRQEHQK